MTAGTKVIDQMVAFQDRSGQAHKSISQEDFDLWQYDYTWDGLHGIRYGQSFCNRFGISDNLLYYTTWPVEQQDEYIKRTYLERN